MQSLQQQLADTQAELGSLQHQYNLGEKRLVRASKLISALGDEAGRWGQAADSLLTRLHLLVGQSLLPANLQICCCGTLFLPHLFVHVCLSAIAQELRCTAILAALLHDNICCLVERKAIAWQRSETIVAGALENAAVWL